MASGGRETASGAPPRFAGAASLRAWFTTVTRRGGDKPSRSQAYLTEAAPETAKKLPRILQQVAPVELVVTDDKEPCLQRGRVIPNKTFLRDRVTCVINKTPAAALGSYFLSSAGQPVKYTKRMLSADLHSGFLFLPARPTAPSPMGVDRGPVWERKVQWSDIFHAALEQHDAAQRGKKAHCASATPAEVGIARPNGRPAGRLVEAIGPAGAATAACGRADGWDR